MFEVHGEVKAKNSARFTGLERVPAYLQRCVNSLHIDRWRKTERERLAFVVLGVDNPHLG